MNYRFNNEVVAKIKVTEDSGSDITLNGINGRETNAGSIMLGVQTLFDIVGWTVTDATRIVNQDIEETT